MRSSGDALYQTISSNKFRLDDVKYGSVSAHTHLMKKRESEEAVLCIFEEKITVFVFLDGGVDESGAKAEAKVTNVLLDEVEMLFAVVELLLKIRCE